MENIRQKFLDDALLKIENLLPALSHESFDENLRRELFRTLHTLKGTSQTLGFHNPGKLAHELENLLEIIPGKKDSEQENLISLLRQGAEILHEALCCARDGNKEKLPHEFLQKLRALLPRSAGGETDFFSDSIPPDVLKKLSVQEKKSLREALNDGKIFYQIEVEFSLSDFAEKFRQLRETLAVESEIVANFPKPDVSDPGRIGFRIYLTSAAPEKFLAKIADSAQAKLTVFNSNKNFEAGENFAVDLKGVLEQTIFAGKKLARHFDKNIEIETTAGVSEVSSENLKLISEILLHLVRNAVDHAIDKDGRIKIDIKAKNHDLILRVADDGRGLDRRKILSKAFEKNLIGEDENLSPEEIFDLIFAHGFSTAETISEISGRGVGLDVVRDAVEKAGGKIRVASQSNQGTIFEINLPKK